MFKSALFTSLVHKNKGITILVLSAENFVGNILVFSKNVEIILYLFGKGKVWKFWAATNKKQIIMKIINFKVSKATTSEIYFVWIFFRSRNTELDMQVSNCFLAKTSFDFVSKNLFLFKVIFCKHFDLCFFNLTVPIFWNISKLA